MHIYIYIHTQTVCAFQYLCTNKPKLTSNIPCPLKYRQTNILNIFFLLNTYTYE